MTDADYTSYSRAHKAMGSFTKDNVFLHDERREYWD